MWRGLYCGISQPSQLIIRDQDSWETFWKSAMAPYGGRKVAPPVDFESDMIVGVFLGRKPQPLSDIRIVDSRRIQLKDQPETLCVLYRELEQIKGAFSPNTPIQPYSLKKIPVFNGPVVFQKYQKKSP